MEIRCPCCQALLALADSAAGKRALCPSCDTEFRVPELPPQAEAASPWPEQTLPDPLVRCPACERTLAYDPALSGQAIICPTCGRRLRMPGPGEQVIDLGVATASRPQERRPTATAQAPFPNFGENPYAGPLAGGPLRPRPVDVAPSYAAPGAILLILSAIDLFFGSILFCMAFLGAIVAGQFESLFVLLMLSLALLTRGLGIAGGLQMIQRRNLWLAKIGAWAALFPCGMFSVFQVPIAIWALVLLHRDRAAADFDLPAARPSASRQDA